jgi:transcriptional regulator with XRE-family HTH domain
MTREELKALRARLGFTQEELAEKVGVARNTINRWEMGIRHIPEPVVRLMDYLTKEVREEQKSKTTQKPTRQQARKGPAS